MAAITLEEMLNYSPLNTGGRENVPAFERKLLGEILSFIRTKKRFIIAIEGLRRVGKSVLLKQLLNKLSDDRPAFYFSFDKKAHQNPGALEEVVSFFAKKGGANSVICLDEIGGIDDWPGIIKKYYDRSNCTFLVSSSAAIHVKKGSESLAGRMLNYTLPPLGFDEYLELKKAESAKAKFYFSNPEATGAFGEYLDEFLQRGSYPELADIDDQAVVKSYVKNSTVEKMVFEDIPSAFKIEHVSKLLEIYYYFANYSADFVHEASIANAVGISQPTVEDYVSYLEQSHLVQRVFTEANYAKKIRKKKKGFVASPALYFNTTSNFSQGKLVETAVFDKLRPFGPQTYFDAQKHEVDFILKAGKTIRPIEVKSSHQVSASELKSLSYYLEKKRLGAGYVVYNGPYDSLQIGEKEIHLIPLSTFLASSEIIP